MKPVRTFVLQATVLALLLISLSASPVSADEGLPTSENTSGIVQNLLPEDPGLE